VDRTDRRKVRSITRLMRYLPQLKPAGRLEGAGMALKFSINADMGIDGISCFRQSGCRHLAPNVFARWLIGPIVGSVFVNRPVGTKQCGASRYRPAER